MTDEEKRNRELLRENARLVARLERTEAKVRILEKDAKRWKKKYALTLSLYDRMGTALTRYEHLPGERKQGQG